MKYKGKDIEQLIPQRKPFVMVDEFEAGDAPTTADSLTGASCVTSLSVRTDNYFMLPGGEMSASGLIEHIAQSASAFAGYQALQQGATTPPVGYIGEVKRFHCYRRPAIGEQLHTTIIMGAEVAGVTMLTGETRVGEEVVADTQMKIFVEQ